jgi:Flp pilus assembly protein CpaB
MVLGERGVRSRRRAFTSRVSTGHVVMVLAGVLGALLTLNVLRAADDTTPVLVAATDLAPGSVIDTSSVRVARVHADADVLASLIPGSELEDVQGQVATGAAREGSMLSRDLLQPLDAGRAGRLMSFPITRARAVAGQLSSGDAVDVLAVERDTGRSGYVVTSVPVVSVSGSSSGPLDTDGDFIVTVSIEPAAATRLAAALEVATVTLVRSTGAAPLSLPELFAPSGTGVSDTAATVTDAADEGR